MDMDWPSLGERLEWYEKTDAEFQRQIVEWDKEDALERWPWLKGKI